MAIYQLGALVPQIHETAYVAHSAEVIGDVQLAEGSSVWFGVVIRGDSDAIRIGKGSNVQDLSMLHADAGVPLTIGENVTIGHQVMLHGCSIGDGSLIGIQAVVLNNAKIGKNCLVGAGSVVTEGKEFPDNALIIGAPAKVVRIMSDEQIAMLQGAAKHYQVNGPRFAKELKKIRD
ncbi:MAG: gamma carbonic anhydrase family protein [Cytophagales bacterium]|nr:gamma carbonic anhydrase family protein [Cytophagales bacterium]